MGLGLFIAKTLLERTGARVSFANGAEPAVRRGGGARGPAAAARPTGAIVEAAWPRGEIDRAPGGRRPALGPNEGFSFGHA